MKQDYWIKASDNFVHKYQEWKTEPIPLVRTLNTNSSQQVLKMKATHSICLSPVESHQDKTFTLQGDIFDYLIALEKTNAELQNQLDVALGNLKDSDVSHTKALEASRNLNEKLQERLANTMSNFKRAESEHTQQIKSLEEDVEYLRSQLDAVLSNADDLRRKKDQLVKEKTEILKETKDLEQSDQQLISDLHARIEELEALNQKLNTSNKDLEGKNQQQETELRECWNRIQVLHSALQQTRETASAFEEQQQVIEELRLQLEQARDQCQNLSEQVELQKVPSGHRLVLTNEGWEWTPWLERTAIKAWEIDIDGLYEEILDLQRHRTQAFIRTKNETANLIRMVVSYVPFSDRFL